MRKLAVVVLMMLLSSAALTFADISWGFDGGGSFFLRNELGVALAASDADSSVGVFLQLIHITSGSAAHTPDAAVNDGVSGGDVVLQYDFLGHNDFTEGGNPITDGQWIQGANYNGAGLTLDHYYFVRAWNLPSDGFGSGSIDTSANSRYADGTPLQYNGVTMINNPTAAANLDTTTLLTPVPEPTIMAMGLFGVLAIRFFRRKV